MNLSTDFYPKLRRLANLGGPVRELENEYLNTQIFVFVYDEEEDGVRLEYHFKEGAALDEGDLRTVLICLANFADKYSLDYPSYDPRQLSDVEGHVDTLLYLFERYLRLLGLWGINPIIDIQPQNRDYTRHRYEIAYGPFLYNGEVVGPRDHATRVVKDRLKNLMSSFASVYVT